MTLLLLLILSNASFLSPSLANNLAPSLTLTVAYALARCRAARRSRFSAPLACISLALLCAFPFHQGSPPPLPLPALLPSLLVASAALPTLLSVLPTRKHSTACAFALALLASFAQALYFCITASAARAATTANATRPVSLFDIAVFVPFHASVPAFIAGLLLARLLRPEPDRPPFLHPGASAGAAVLTTVLLIFLPSSLSPFTPHFILFLVALLIALVSTLWSSVVGPSSATFSPAPRWLEPVALCSLSAYALQNSLWRLLSKLACPRFCFRTSSPWLGVAVSSSGDASPGPNLYKASSMRPSLFLFAPALIVLSLVAGYCFVRPFMQLFSYLRRRHLDSERVLQLPAWYARLHEDDAAVGGSIASFAVRKELNAGERAIRAFLFFTGMFAFMAVVWKLSWPVSITLSNHTKTGSSLLCRMLPSFIHSCELRARAQISSGHASEPLLVSTTAVRVAPSAASSVLAFGVDVVRWISVLCLPAMIFNVLGHVLYPMPLWRGLPSVGQMLSSRNRKKLTCPPPALASASLPELDMDFVLHVRYVTRGTNPRLVARNVRDAALILRSAGIPPSGFVIEVVTDAPVGLDAKLMGDVTLSEIVVPSGYHPPCGARFKARALQYAIGVSNARDFDWIVHLDEETRFGMDTVAAIMLHCGRQNHAVRVAKSASWPRIGQGPIMYGRCMVPGRSSEHDFFEDSESDDEYDRPDFTSDNYLEGDFESDRPTSGNWVTTLADSTRVSDDLGRYRTQFELGEVWVGMHGSFVVTANCVEKLIAWDHGVEGSIAEDAYFALLARSNDVRFSWIDAFMYEQSPFSFHDFVKQRARWLVGGFKVCSASKIPVRIRAGMACLTCLWALMPFTYISLILSISLGHVETSRTDGSWWYFHFMLPLMAVISLWGYLYGFLVTYSVRDLGVFRFSTLLYMQLALTPVYGVMEVSSVAYALWNFTKVATGFHVVQKESQDSLSASMSECTVEENSPLLCVRSD